MLCRLQMLDFNQYFPEIVLYGIILDLYSFDIARSNFDGYEFYP